MKTMGEYLFNSFEEALAFVNEPTNYEKAKGIKILYSELAIDKPDFKVLKIFKNDDSISLCLFFKNSTLYDIWKFWFPSEDQLEQLKIVIALYLRVNDHNLNLPRNKLRCKEKLEGEIDGKKTI